MRTSYSALQTFRECPLRYKAQYIDKIPQPQSIEAFFGVLIHSVLEYMMNPQNKVPTESELKHRFQTMWAESAFSGTEREEEFMKAGADMIRTFYEKNIKIRPRVYAVEKKFLLHLDEHQIFGYIDRIDKLTDDDEYEIIDYKTGRSFSKDIDLSENLQLAIYVLALCADSPLLPPKRIVATLMGLRDYDILSYEYSNDELMRAKNTILETIHDIELATKNNDFATHKNGYCDVCPLRSRCPEWK